MYTSYIKSADSRATVRARGRVNQGVYRLLVCGVSTSQGW